MTDEFKLIPMKKTEYRRAIDALGLSQVKASDFFAVSRKTSPRWARGEAPIPGAIARLLRLMVHRKIPWEEVVELDKISPEEVDN
jgi:DNA-binding transcriptional regulator YiaG